MRPGMTPGAGTRQYAQQWLYNQLTSVGGLSEQEAIQVVAGAMTPLEVDQRAGDLAEKEFAALMKDGQRMIPPGGNAKKRLSEWSDQERAAYIEMLKRQKLQSMSGLVQSRPGGRSGPTPDPLGLYEGEPL
jgi:hypothetical protein